MATIMNIIKNIPIKEYLKLTNLSNECNNKLKELNNNMFTCFKLGDSPEYDYTEVILKPKKYSTFNENKFDELIKIFNKDIVLIDKYNDKTKEFLNYFTDIDVKVYMNKVDIINTYTERRLHHKTLLTIIEKEKYATFIMNNK